MESLSFFVAGPVLPATLLLGLLIAWSVLAMLGAVDLEMPGSDLDADLDLDVDASGASGSAGDGVALLMFRWLNLHNIPLIIWAGVFSICWWGVSATLWLAVDSRFFDEAGWLWSTALVLRNVAISLPLTKLITQPMRGWFQSEQLSATSIIGSECQISSLEASPEFGQVRLKTDGAPLLLNVRTDGPHLAQGAAVWITHYDAKRRLYIVSPTGTESPSEPNT